MVRVWGEARSSEREVARDARTEGLGGMGEELIGQQRSVGLREGGAPPRFRATSWTWCTGGEAAAVAGRARLKLSPTAGVNVSAHLRDRGAVPVNRGRAEFGRHAAEVLVVSNVNEDGR